MPEYQPMATNTPGDPIVRAYLECAEWCGLIEESDREALELAVMPQWDSRALAEADEICLDFLRELSPVLSSLEDDGCRGRAGHDLWLTRNRHGAGFWDGDWPEPFATKATKYAHEIGGRGVWFDEQAEVLTFELA